MAKMTIYVPDDLKRRMDEAEGVNWSPLACQAFEAKVAEIITKRGAKDMQDVVARLKASRGKSASEAQRAGHAAGVGWAKTSAEAVELERLEELAAEPNHGIANLWAGESAYGPGERFVFAIRPEDDGDRDAARDFWEFVAGPDFEADRDYVEGFADGALAVWDEVKDQL